MDKQTIMEKIKNEGLIVSTFGDETVYLVSAPYIKSSGTILLVKSKEMEKQNIPGVEQLVCTDTYKLEKGDEVTLVPKLYLMEEGGTAYIAGVDSDNVCYGCPNSPLDLLESALDFPENLLALKRLSDGPSELLAKKEAMKGIEKVLGNANSLVLATNVTRPNSIDGCGDSVVDKVRKLQQKYNIENIVYTLEG